MTRVPLAALAARQHGVVSRQQLASLGLSPSMIEVRIEGEHLIRLHRGVYALGHSRLRTEGHWLAAVLACGPGAALSHRDAAALHGLRPCSRSRIDVTTARRIRAGRPGIDVHHSATLGVGDISIVDGIPVTTVARTLVDLADVVPGESVAKALREAEHLRVVDVRDLRSAMARTRNRPGPGNASLRAVLEEHRARGTQLTRDRTKANQLMRAGWRVLRFTHDDVVRRPAETAATIDAFLQDA